MGSHKALHRKGTIAATLSDGAQCGATDCVGVCEWQTRKGFLGKCPFHLANWVKCTSMQLLLKTHWCHILMWQQRAAQGNVIHIGQMKMSKLFRLTLFWLIRVSFLKKRKHFDNVLCLHFLWFPVELCYVRNCKSLKTNLSLSGNNRKAPLLISGDCLLHPARC